MAAEKEVGPEVEVLLPAVTRDIRREDNMQTSPCFVIFLPGLHFLNGEPGERQKKWRGEVGPKRVPVEISPIEVIPTGINGLAFGMLGRIETFTDDCSVFLFECDALRREIRALVECAVG